MANSWHRGLPALWAKNQLEASPVFVAIFHDRIYEGRKVRKPEYPFAYVQVPPAQRVRQAVGAQQQILSVDTVVEVVTVWHFTRHEESAFDFQPTLDAMMAALCPRFMAMDVEKDGAKIGEVWQSAYLRDIEFEGTNGDDTAAHRGIALTLTHI